MTVPSANYTGQRNRSWTEVEKSVKLQVLLLTTCNEHLLRTHETLKLPISCKMKYVCGEQCQAEVDYAKF